MQHLLFVLAFALVLPQTLCEALQHRALLASVKAKREADALRISPITFFWKLAPGPVREGLTLAKSKEPLWISNVSVPASSSTSTGMSVSSLPEKGSSFPTPCAACSPGGNQISTRRTQRPATPITPEALKMKDPVPITILPSGETRGVCMDGSPPAYHLSPGSGEDARNWLIFLQGGGWCTAPGCTEKARTDLGSSHLMSRFYDFAGVYSSKQHLNPLMYSWTRVVVRYCDGGSFSGTAGKNFGGQNATSDGANLFARVIKHLLVAENMENGTHILLTGSSAGGLATLLRCDDLSRIVRGHERSSSLVASQQVVVKCVSDGGFFSDLVNFTGVRHVRSMFKAVQQLHKIDMNGECVRRAEDDPVQVALCMFPDNFVSFIETPVFLINSVYDYWSIYANTAFDPSWKECQYNLSKCSPEQMSFLHKMKDEVMQSLKRHLSKQSVGAFITSCHSHAISKSSDTWHGETAPKLFNQTVDVVTHRWFFDLPGDVVLIDGPFGSNPTCKKHSGWR